jgi:hypothetical protein
LVETQHSRLPAGDGGVDVMVGVVQTRDVLAAILAGRTLDPRKHVRAAPIVYDQADALDVLQKLVDTGNTVIVIEHHLDVIKSADYVIDLGPEGGAGGGKLVAVGTPEEIARVRRSYTGQALKGVLN